MGAFHAYDIRGKWNVDFDRDTVYKVGYFLPELLSCRKVLVGRDMRVSSPQLHDALLAGLTDAGADVYDLGIATTPYVYYATAAKGFEASVQITASHNPKEDNGLKVSRKGASPVAYDSGLGTIETWIRDGRACMPVAEQERGQVIPMDLREEYLRFQRRFVGDCRGLKICADLSNGVAGIFVKDLLPKDVQYICDEPDGNFPNHDPNPLKPENTAMLREYVRREGCDVGVIYDGDADRVMFVDERGCFISPDLIIALLGHFFLEGTGSSEAAEEIRQRLAGHVNGKVRVLQDIRTSKSVGEYLVPMGVEMHTWRVGRAFAAPRLKEIDGLFGGELAGHYYFKDFFYSDSGIMASLIVLDVVSEFKRRGKTLSQLVAGISRYCSSGEVNFRVEDKRGAMEAVKEHFLAEAAPDKVMDFDGYRVEFPDWWFNIRPSNTEPYLRFICEAATEDLLKDKLSVAEGIIKSFC